MNKIQLEILDYLVEYSDLLESSSLEIAEKILFDGGIDDLDSLEKEAYQNDIAGLLKPACKGTDQSGCHGTGDITPELVLAGYQNGDLLCQTCQEISGLREAS